ncbi:preprotein translocase subunit SecG [Salinibacillus xinjiangensis]|uniref:Protein-export membrane protein SecG n=1 Tax=Salinibacillus xinjiangensis TaxID=1229268 RepID=A0A6G1X1F9_9BACI|nr:preprotein translocase subunit SecG [Salinibacillus xinjiangensis]MRG84715.1 preprotein translocase subunit SecG [Salinibacillus xinjiangensis]
MYGLFITLLVIDALIMIVLVLLQSGKSAGLSGAISGGAEQLFGKQKARGIDAVLHRATIVTGILFFVFTFALGYIVQA